MKKQQKREAIIVCTMLVVAVIIIAVMKLTTGGSKVVVSVAGNEYGTYNLNFDREVEIKSENGVNVLKIENGQAKMISATCPDKICVHMSPLSEDMIGLIVCLPNQVVVEVKEE